MAHAGKEIRLGCIGLFCSSKCGGQRRSLLLLLTDDVGDIRARNTDPAQFLTDIKNLVPFNPGIPVFIAGLRHKIVAALPG